jgi:hypothetical protein
MNLDREHLIKIVDAKLATHKAAWEKEHAEDLARYRKAAEVWIATMGPKWTVAISNMTKALKANKPIPKAAAIIRGASNRVCVARNTCRQPNSWRCAISSKSAPIRASMSRSLVAKASSIR